MATKRVIAYFMDGAEEAAASRLLKSAEVTESFVVGDLEEENIAVLRRQGLIVQELPVRHRRQCRQARSKSIRKAQIPD